MGRFHRHPPIPGHDQEHDHDHDHGHDHDHDHQHGDLSGYATAAERVDVLEAIFDENDAQAFTNRETLTTAGITAVNLMSSPGSGKTTLLTTTLRALADELRLGVVVGDIATDLDAVRLRGLGAQVALLNTANGYGGECHLDAPMVARALADLDLATLDLVIIENVGNLVCPAEFDTGAQARAMLWSVTEGEDKPLKYPVMFASVDLVVISKTDLLPHLDVDVAAFREHLHQLNPVAEVIEVSARTGAGIPAWLDWLRAHHRSRPAQHVAPNRPPEPAE